MCDLFPLPVGERARVRGFLTCGGDDRLQYAINAVDYVIIPKPQNEIAVRLKVSCPLRILRVALSVLAAIKLDY
jgi:hypothetical protein